MDNEASRVWFAAVEALVEGDIPALISMYAARLVRDDRRQLGAPSVEDRKSAIASDMATLASMRLVGWAGQVLETRGDHLALMAIEFVTEENFVIPGLVVGETDTDGCISRGVYFDSDDQDAALAELDHRSTLLEDDAPQK